MTDNAANNGAATDTGTDAGTDRDEAAPEIRVLAGNATASELAAVTAVLTALAGEAGGRMPAAAPARGAWSISQRQLRPEIIPGAGAWNRQNL